MALITFDDCMIVCSEKGLRHSMSLANINTVNTTFQENLRFDLGITVSILVLLIVPEIYHDYSDCSLGQ